MVTVALQLTPNSSSMSTDGWSMDASMHGSGPGPRTDLVYMYSSHHHEHVRNDPSTYISSFRVLQRPRRSGGKSQKASLGFRRVVRRFTRTRFVQTAKGAVSNPNGSTVSRVLKNVNFIYYAQNAFTSQGNSCQKLTKSISFQRRRE